MHCQFDPPITFCIFYHAHVLCCEDINRHYRLKVYTVSRWWCPYVCNDGYFEILASHLTFFTDAIMYRKNRYICSSSTYYTSAALCCPPLEKTFSKSICETAMCALQKVFLVMQRRDLSFAYWTSLILLFFQHQGIIHLYLL